MPQLASEPGDNKTESREHTEIGIMVGAARTPAPLAMPDSAVLQPPAEQSAPAPAPRAPTSPTATHRGLPAVQRQPGPLPEDYAQLLARHHALLERYEEHVEQHEDVLNRSGTLLTWLEGRVVRLEQKLADARRKVEEQAAELTALRDSLRRSQGARDAVLLVLQEVALNPPNTKLFRGNAAAALAAIAGGCPADPPSTNGAST